MLNPTIPQEVKSQAYKMYLEQNQPQAVPGAYGSTVVVGKDGQRWGIPPALEKVEKSVGPIKKQQFYGVQVPGSSVGLPSMQQVPTSPVGPQSSAAPAPGGPLSTP